MIRIVLAEDHALVREGIASLLALEPDFALVAQAVDGVEAVAACEDHDPDVLVLDMRMPKLDGLGVLRELATRGNQPATLVLTTFDDDEAARHAIAAGARGFLLKDVTRATLVKAVRTVASGQSMISPAVTDGVHRAVDRDDTAADRLSAREREVLRLMAAGYSNREIAKALFVADGTVKNHVSNILTKLATRDRTRAVLRALERGYI